MTTPLGMGTKIWKIVFAKLLRYSIRMFYFATTEHSKWFGHSSWTDHGHGWLFYLLHQSLSIACSHPSPSASL